MRIVVEVRHPAHVHHFRPFIAEMRGRGHEVRVMAVSKDISVDLLERYGIAYTLIGTKRRGLLRTGIEQWAQTLAAIRFCRRFRPDVLVGRPSQSVNMAGFALGIPRIIFAEDDLAVAPLAGIVAYPFVTVVLSPHATQLGRFEHKKVPYHGYQKLAYLHPSRFTPDRAVVEPLLGGAERFFLLRLAKLSSHHDVGVGGIGDAVLRRVVELLSARGKVFISAERPLPPEMEPYRIRIDPTQIHHFLYYAELFVADSQSMTVEAAMLGTPSLRFSGFAGRISVLEELEHRYGLTRGIPAGDPEPLYAAIDEVLAVPGLRAEWHRRRDRMLAEKIDLTAFMVWFVENYPASVERARRDPAVQDLFRRAAADPAETQGDAPRTPGA